MKNYIKKTRIHILAATVLSLSAVSCSDTFDTSYFDKEIEDPTIGLGLKIGYSEYSASELFEEIGDDIEVGTTDDNGNPLVSFIYSKQLDSKNTDEFISIDNQKLDGAFFPLLRNSGLPAEISYLPGMIANDELGDSFTEIQTIQNSGPELTEIEFSEGTLTIVFESNMDAQTEIQVSIPTLREKNTPNTYSQLFTLNNIDAAEGDFISTSIDLNEYILDLTYDNLNPSSKNGFNNVAIQLNTFVTFEEGDLVGTNNNFTYSFDFEDLKIDNTKGDFKNSAFNIDNETIDLDFFDTLGEGEITFLNPSLKLTATSGYGFPIGLTLESIAGTNENETINLIIEDNTPLDDNIEPISNGIGNFAIIDAAETNGSTKISEIVLNADNSNIEDLLNAKPTSFNLDVTASANPNSPTDNENFFDIDNPFDVDVTVELPLYVTFDGLTFTPDPFEFDGEDVEDLEENASSLDLLLFTRNSIPLSGKVTLEFLDSNGNVAFTKDANLMEAAPINNNSYSQYIIDANGDLKEGSKTIEPTKTIISFENAVINNLTNISEIQAVIEFNTTNSSAAKIQSTDKVRLDLSIIADLKL